MIEREYDYWQIFKSNRASIMFRGRFKTGTPIRHFTKIKSTRNNITGLQVIEGSKPITVCFSFSEIPSLGVSFIKVCNQENFLAGK